MCQLKLYFIRHHLFHSEYKTSYFGIYARNFEKKTGVHWTAMLVDIVDFYVALFIQGYIVDYFSSV